jgi:hypothetical protein
VTDTLLKATLRVVPCVVALAAAAPLRAQAPHVVPRLTGPITLDGRSDEPAWQEVAPLPAVMMQPTAGAEPSERTEFRVAHDGEFLYVAGRMYDSDVRGIRATSLRRDDGSLSNDWLCINLDTFRDGENMLGFGVNPAGGRTDVAFSGDGATSNFNWNTFWDARTARDAQGWYAEIRIPLSSLRFDVRDGSVAMGMTVWRNIARKNEIVSWPGIDARWGMTSVFKASLAGVVVMEGVARRNPVYATPYLLGGGARRNIAQAALPIRAEDTFAREGGLDLKYSPAPSITVDVTVNTDFAQVEADDQQVNLTRFSLFFPEKRLFFQERSAVFQLGLGGSDQLFYSRRIGLAAGEPVRIYGGVRTVGRVGEWDVALLDMHTESGAPDVTENAGVVRLRRRVLNDVSYAGGLLTTRITSTGAVDLAGGADATLRVRGQNYLTAVLAATDNDVDADTLDARDRAFARLAWERRGNFGLLYDAQVVHAGGGFRPALGFLGRGDHARAAGRLGYGWRMPAGSRMLRHSATLSGGAWHRYALDRIETAELAAEWYGETRTGHSLTLAASRREEHLTGSFSIGSGIAVPAGTYRFAGGRVAYSPAQTGLLRTSAAVEAGRFYDGRRITTSISPTWNPSRHLQLTGTWQFNAIDFEERGQRYRAHVARIRPQLMVSDQLSGVAFVQFNSATDAVVVNVRARYTPRDGNDLYVVYNHGLNTDRFAYEPVRPLTDNRTLLVKYSHTLQF